MCCPCSRWRGEIGLFKALASGPLTIPEIAKAVGASEVGVTRLVEALVGMGYLEKEGARHVNGPAPRLWYVPTGQADYTPFLKFIGEVWPLFGKLAESVRLGRPESNMYQLMELQPQIGKHFSQYMRANAQLRAKPISEMFSLPDTAHRLLDLGGSHGLYSIAYCRRNPNLRATIFDLPAALSDTEEIIAAEGLSDRISVQRGDYLKDDVGEGYDAVLCFGIIDGNSYEENANLFKNIAGALNPGGQVMILSHVRPEPTDAFNALFSLIMFTTYGTRTYSFDEITEWLRDAGFANFEQRVLQGGTSMVTATLSGSKA
jgi:SAM-dependent methyltransferase